MAKPLDPSTLGRVGEAHTTVGMVPALLKRTTAAQTVENKTTKTMKTSKHLILALGCWSLAMAGLADVIELKNGTVLNGKYVGGTESAVQFDSGSGPQAIQTSTIISLTFTTSGKAAAATAASAPPSAVAPAPAAQARSVTIPAGTTLMVRMMDSVSSQNKAGTPFTAKLETDLSGTGGMAVKGGATIYGRIQSSTQAGRAVGRSTLDLRLTQIVVNGQPVSIMTSGYQEAGQKSGAKVAKGAAAGAAIGAIAGDAGKGAAIGAVAGGVLRGQSITVPPGTLLEFTLTQAVTLPAAT